MRDKVLPAIAASKPGHHFVKTHSMFAKVGHHQLILPQLTEELVSAFVVGNAPVAVGGLVFSGPTDPATGGCEGGGIVGRRLPGALVIATQNPDGVPGRINPGAFYYIADKTGFYPNAFGAELP